MSLRNYPRWFWLFTLAALVLSSLPYLYGWFATPDKHTYLGVHTNLDDQAVYAAWTKQAMEGRLLFENRFTTDAQPRLTINLYFFVAGNIARAIGIPLAMHFLRLLFGTLFLMAVFRLSMRLTLNEFAQKVSLTLTTFGGGIGFLFWQRYGQAGPIDIWQPEAFGFPSLMTNGLFCASLWLMLVIWESILESSETWSRVLVGAVALLVLANIHTYDVLTIALVGIGFLCAMIGSKGLTSIWVLRTGVITCGALPAVAWFVIVRALDPVFAARAATVTLSPKPQLVIWGFALLLPLAWAGAAVLVSRRWLSVLMIAASSVCGMFAASATQSFAAYVMVFVLVAASLATLRSENKHVSLIISWAAVGLVAFYYPGLFQRKLIAGLFVPLGLMSGIAVSKLTELKSGELFRRPLAVAAVVACCLTSLFWLLREVQMAQENVSNTTLHSVYLNPDYSAILKILQTQGKPDEAAISIPGVQNKIGNEDFGTPLVSDFNPVMAGWGGVKTYASHWSETPDYLNKRTRLMRNVYSREATPETVAALLDGERIAWVVWPTSQAFQDAGVPPPSILGERAERVYFGEEFSLYKIN